MTTDLEAQLNQNKRDIILDCFSDVMILQNDGGEKYDTKDRVLLRIDKCIEELNGADYAYGETLTGRELGHDEVKF